MDTNTISAAMDEPQGQKEPIHDETYFFDDGDCMVLAGGIVFKLHKWALCRDPDSMFRDMFNIPQGPQSVLDGIPECSDSADDFRALCWAVYALPAEILLQNEREADITRLAAVANMCHKYILPSFESWALDIVWSHCQPRIDYLDDRPCHPGIDYLSDCPPDMLCRIFEAAQAGGRPDLCTLVEERWLPRLKTGELQLRQALDFGEKHGRRKFLGDAYYQQALDMKSCVPTIDPSQPMDLSQSNLTDMQMHRLLSGYCSLSVFLKRLGAYTIPNTVGCQQHDGRMSDILVLPTEPLDVMQGLRGAVNARSPTSTF
ncbi:hypothetical protein C8R44DRAFT_730672 [Mycena epipterygia]|nr:hypothetical protein C8R44DRAFT_730672 [Mycena epipterygia]